MLLCLAVGASTAAAEPSGACASRRAGWASPADGTPELAVINRVGVAHGRELHWNGVRIDLATLRSYLQQVSRMAPLPFTILAPGPEADCGFLDAVRDEMEAALPCTRGACGEGAGHWGYAAMRPPPSDAEIDRIMNDMANAAMAAQNEAVAEAKPPKR